MGILSKFRTIAIVTAVITLNAASYARAQDYGWLKSPGYESIFVYIDFDGDDRISAKLKETVARTFSRSNINATISNSFIFKITDEDKNSVYELVDEELIENSKIILHIHGKCIRYNSGYIYQFDANFGVNDAKSSQALLYATPRHSVIGVDSIMGIDRVLRTLIRNAVNDYWFANQTESAEERNRIANLRSSR